MFRIILFILFTTIGCIEINEGNEKISAKDGILSEIGNNMWNYANVIKNFKEIFKIVSSDKKERTSIFSLLPIPEDAKLNISQLTNKYGYDLEEHQVITDDKYILTMHRLFSRRNTIKNGKVVFLMHGILDSSDSWILQGPEKALGYILADKGFDVWLGNARGNKYSLKHEMISSNESDYWQFTWEEIGLYDLPAMIDQVLNITNTKSLYYIGHSQGTTSFYVMTSMKQEYNAKIEIMFSLAPVSYVSHAKSPIIKMFSPAYNIISYFFSGFNAFAPSTDTLNRISAVICTILPTRCDSFLYMIVGNDFQSVDKSLVPVISGHIPAGSSLSQFVHFGQLFQSGRFCRFDFGEEGNQLLYEQDTPPEYALENVTVPIALYYSNNDWLSDVQDVNILRSKLPNAYDAYFIENFNHFDFLFSSAAKDKIYSRIIKQIEEFDMRNHILNNVPDILGMNEKMDNNAI